MCEKHSTRKHSKDKEKLADDMAKGKLDSFFSRIPCKPYDVSLIVDKDSAGSNKELLALMYRCRNSKAVHVKIFDVNSRVMLQYFTVMPPPGFEWYQLQRDCKNWKDRQFSLSEKLFHIRTRTFTFCHDFGRKSSSSTVKLFEYLYSKFAVDNGDADRQANYPQCQIVLVWSGRHKNCDWEDLLPILRDEFQSIDLINAFLDSVSPELLVSSPRTDIFHLYSKSRYKGLKTRGKRSKFNG